MSCSSETTVAMAVGNVSFEDWLDGLHGIVGVHGGLGAHGAARDLDGAVGDNLVGVHVRLGARTGLEDEGKLSSSLPERRPVAGLTKT